MLLRFIYKLRGHLDEIHQILFGLVYQIYAILCQIEHPTRHHLKTYDVVMTK